MKTTFTEVEKRFLYSLGVPRGMVYLWSRGQPIGRKYAREVAQVKGINLIDVLYPQDKEESEMPEDA